MKWPFLFNNYLEARTEISELFCWFFGRIEENKILRLIQFKNASNNLTTNQRYTYRGLQTIQMKFILLCVWAEPAVLGSTKTALKFKYEIYFG